MSNMFMDSESNLVNEHFAVIYAPGRRKRFPENCVEVFDSEAEALAAADPKQERVAAVVMGPSRSSEGFRLYYLVRWLES